MATINYKDPTSGNWVEIPIGGSSVTVDSELSSTSENPVQNKVINSALNGKLTTPTTPTADSAIVIGANGNVSTKLLTEFSPNITAITSSPSEGTEVMRGINIDGTDYAFPNRHRHTIYLSGEVSTVISFDNDSYLGITDINEIPQFIHYPAYIYSGGQGVLDLYGDGSSYTISGCYVTDGGEVATISMSDMGINYQDVTDL